METREYSAAQKPTDILLMDLLEHLREAVNRKGMEPMTRHALSELLYSGDLRVKHPETEPFKVKFDYACEAFDAALKYEAPEPDFFDKAGTSGIEMQEPLL